MDESGHSGDTGAADSGNGADARERVRVNGWATPDSPWSLSGSALESDDDVPAWRRPSTESRPFPRSQIFPTSAMPASGVPAAAPSPPGFVEAPPGEEPAEQRTDRWPESRPRYSDLLAHLSPPGGEPARPPSPRVEPTGVQPRDETTREPGLTTGAREPGRAAGAREPGLTTGAREPGLSTGAREPGRITGGRPTSLRGFDVPTPSSAPPYPYEGDLEDPQPRPAVPLVRPATPGGRRADWGPADSESARHALASTTQGIPRIEPASPEAPAARPSYDPSSFPRRVSYEPAPAPDSSGYVPPAAYAAFNRSSGANDPRPEDSSTRVLPQRVPAQPDVPKVPEPPLVEPTAETPALARIATHLRRGDVLPVQERQEGFDVQAILAAVREVDGVRDASLRSTPAGAHSLRLDLAEGADAAEVSRRVARLLSERMGLDAAMKGEALPPFAAPPTPPAPAPVSPSALVPSERPGPISALPLPEARVPEPRAPEKARITPEKTRVAPETARPVERLETRERLESRERPEEKRDRKPETLGDIVEPDNEPGPPRPLYLGEQPGPRIVIDNVHVNTYGTDANVEVRLSVGDRTASGVASGPAVDGYLLRLCAMATAGAVDHLLSTSEHPDGPARCFVEHAAAVPFGSSQVAVVVLLLSCNGWVEQLAGSAVVTSDDRHAMVRATLAAVNRRLEALLSR